MPRRHLLPLLLAPAALLGMPGGALAAPGCTFDPATARVTVDFGGPGTTARISRAAAGGILLDGAPCGAATVFNTDQITATAAAGAQTLVVDLATGPLAPGKTAEAAGVSEIEVDVSAGTGGEYPSGDQVRVVGTGLADTYRVAAAGAQVNADDDVDVTAGGAEIVALAGGEGNDVLTGTAATTNLALEGGGGADTLTGGNRDDTLTGGPGNDVETGGEGRDVFVQGAAPDGADTLDGGPSSDTIDYSSRPAGVRVTLDDVADDGGLGEGDNVRDTFETVWGGAGGDTLVASQTRYQPFDLAGNGGDDKLTGGTSYDVLTGAAGDDTLVGNAGSDTFRGGPDDDLMLGGDGSDTFSEALVAGPNGADDLRGGTGIDIADYRARRAPVRVTLSRTADDGEAGERDNVRSDVETVYGGYGDDVISGGTADNTLNGYDGDDVIRGGDGDDDIDGGQHADKLAGDAGRDDVYGGDHVDKVDGGADDDVVRGSYGADTLFGGPGSDRVEGGTGDDLLVEPALRDGADKLFGDDGIDEVSYAGRTLPVAVTLDAVANDGDTAPASEGDDVRAESVVGGAGQDRLTGGPGNEVLRGMAGPDTLQGGAGADDLQGGPDEDTLAGGSGNDRLEGGTGPDRLDGEGDVDVADYGFRTAKVTVTLNGVADDGEAGERDDVRTEDVLGGTAADSLTGDGGPNRLYGGPQDDVLDGRGGADVLDGGEGEDTASYAGRSTPVSVDLDGQADDGEAGESDQLAVTVENITGGEAGDRLVGDDRANALRGGGGNDRLDGGTGADLLDGEGGRDTADYAQRQFGVSVTLDDQAGDGEDRDGDGVAEEGDRVTAATEIVAGGAGDDRLTGGAADDELYGNGGVDTLTGRGGADTLSGGPGADTASYADRGADAPVVATLDGGYNDGAPGERDSIRNDVEGIAGGDGDDQLTGNGADNVLAGGGGDDVLQGLGGKDRLHEGAEANGMDRLSGGEGRDTVDDSARTAALTVTLDNDADDGAEGEQDNVYLDVEDVVTGAGDDVIVGSSLDNTLDGGGSGNRISGESGRDTLIGGESVDRLYGGDQDDKLIGGPGNNVQSGGTGDDVFVEASGWVGNDGFDGGAGRDTVDYSNRGTRLVLDNDGAIGDDGQDANGDGTAEERDRIATDVEVLKGGGGDDRITNSVDLPGSCAALYGGGGSDTLQGRGVRETLFGGEGTDTLNGDAGDDFLVGGPGNDVENGGSGSDHFIQGNMSVSCNSMSWSDIAVPDGADQLNGEGGEDYVEYRRSVDITLRLDDAANDGIPGEGDNVKGVEVAFGGSGDDLLVGSESGDVLYGDDGNDRIEGLGGSDELFDRDGVDVLLGGSGGDVFTTDDGDNADTLDGGSGFDSGQWDAGDTRKDI